MENKRFYQIEKHLHNGMDSNELEAEDINRMPVISNVPTHSGKQGESILYKSGTTYRLYTYMDGDWYFVDLIKV